MDISHTIHYGTPGDDDWFDYLNLDVAEAPSLLEGISCPDFMTGLDHLDSSGGNFILETLDSTSPPNEVPLTSIHDAFRIEHSLSKRDRAPSFREGGLTSSSPGKPLKKKARKTRFTGTQTDVLQTWLACHMSYPYPQRKEIEDLAEATGLTVGQIQAWFARTRQRKLRPDKSHPNRT